MASPKKVPFHFLNIVNTKRKLFESLDEENENVFPPESINQNKKLRRPIVTEEDLMIDPELLNTSNGRRIAGWIKLRQQHPVKRGRLFDLDNIRKQDPKRWSLRYLPDKQGTTDDDAQDDEAQQESTSEDEESLESRKPSSLFSKTINKFKDLTKGRKSVASDQSSIPSPIKAPPRNSLARRAVLNKIDEEFNNVASTPMTGSIHRVQLNASASPIKPAGANRISVRKPEDLNKEVVRKSPARVVQSPGQRRTIRNQVCVLDQVVISPKQPDDAMASPIGIVQTTEPIRPKNLSQIIANEQHKSRHLDIPMIPERNENFDECSSNASSNHSNLIDPGEVTDEEEEVIIPETQDDGENYNPPVISQPLARRDSASSSSSVSSSILCGFNESLLPCNELTSRSPMGPPLLRTILSNVNRASTNITKKPNETLTTQRSKKTTRKKSVINSEVKKYLDINKSDTETRRSKSRLTSNKSKRKLYSERFDPENEPEEVIPETQDPEVIVPETQEEEIPAVTQNIRVSQKSNVSDSTRMPPPSMPPKKGQGRQKKVVREYVTPEPVSQKNPKKTNVDVYVDSDQTSDTGASTKSSRNKKKVNWNYVPLVESCDIVNGVRKSKRTKFLKTDKPNARIVVTDEELDKIYKKLAPPHVSVHLKHLNKRPTKHSDTESVRSKSTYRSRTKKTNKNKENIPVESNVPEPLPSITDELPSTPRPKSSNKRSSPKSTTHKAPNIEPVSDVEEPAAKRPRGVLLQEQDVSNEVSQGKDGSHDSGLQSETSNTTAHQSPQAPAIQNPTSPEDAPRRSSQYANRLEWIAALLNPEKSHEPCYETDFDELASSEEIRFVDHGGVQYACYMGSLFKNCGYMRINEKTTKKRGKAVKYDLRFLVMKANDLEVTVGEKTMKPKEGSMFFVKKGVSYSIINHSTSKVLLHFTRTT